MFRTFKAARAGERKLGGDIRNGLYDHPLQRTGALFQADSGATALFDLGAPDLSRPHGDTYDNAWRLSLQAHLGVAIAAADSWLIQNDTDTIVIWTDKRWDTTLSHLRSAESYNAPASLFLQTVGGQPNVTIHGNAVATGANLLSGNGIQIRPLPPRWVSLFQEGQSAESSGPRPSSPDRTEQELDVELLGAVLVGSEAWFSEMGSTPIEWDAWVQARLKDTQIGQDLQFLRVGPNGFSFIISRTEQAVADWSHRNPLATMTMVDIASGGDAMTILEGFGSQMLYGPVIAVQMRRDRSDSRIWPRPLDKDQLDKLLEQTAFARKMSG